MSGPRLAAVAVLLLAVGPAGAQQPQLDVKELMTPAEYLASGLDKLTETERAVLNLWLTTYTQNVIAATQSERTPSMPGTAATGAYPGVGVRHWVREKIGRGEFIKLEDNSLWEISRLDRIYTMLWLPIEEVMVLEADTPIGEYTYWLVNTDAGDKVLAKYMGKAASPLAYR